MTIRITTRRALVLVLGLLGSVPGWAVDLPAAAQQWSVPQQQWLVLNRLGYGPSPDSVTRIQQLGVSAYIDQQLQPQQLPEARQTRQLLATQPWLDWPAARIMARLYQTGQAAGEGISDPQARQLAVRTATNQQSRQLFMLAQKLRLTEAISSPRQLEARLTEFWFNHFNVFGPLGSIQATLGQYERQVIRPRVLGRFEDLLLATARSPIMLTYLNNEKSSRAYVDARGTAHGLNENYAREVMELHTLGVQGGYTQQDVTALAHVLTGWRQDGLGKDQDTRPDGFLFSAALHDPAPQVVLGQRFDQPGEAQGEAALRMLARHPATAQHLSQQLAEFFLADDPPPALVRRMSQRWLATQGDLREVMTVLISSPEFWQQRGQKFKTPYRYLVSTVRASGIQPSNPAALLAPLNAMGMPLYGRLTPDGYPQDKSAWLNPVGLQTRVNFAQTLARGRYIWHAAELQGATPQPEDQPDPATVSRLIDPLLSPQTLQRIQQAPAAQQMALRLAAPEWLYD